MLSISPSRIVSTDSLLVQVATALTISQMVFAVTARFYFHRYLMEASPNVRLKLSAPIGRVQRRGLLLILLSELS